MKILMFGRGVIAALYGWALEKAGHSVDFYVRPGRAAEYGSTLALKFFDARIKFKAVPVEETWTIRLREDLPEGHDYDLIVVSVQHYRFPEVAAFLGPRTGKATVLIFNNLWTDPQAAASPFPVGQVAWGFPMAGGGFDDRGVLKGSLFHKVQFGTFGAAPTDRELAVRDVFRKSGFALEEQRDFRAWLWIHFAVNAALHTQALQDGSLLRVMGSARQIESAILNIRELLPLLTARGVDLTAHASDVALARFPPSLVAVALKLILKFSAPVRLGIESHSNQEELRSTCRDALAEARRLGVAVPRLEAAEAFFSEGPGPE
jgi:2-dehydropantoate 2-reductase